MSARRSSHKERIRRNQLPRNLPYSQLASLARAVQDPTYKEALHQKALASPAEKAMMERVIDALDTEVFADRARLAELDAAGRASLAKKEELLAEYRRIAAAVERSILAESDK